MSPKPTGPAPRIHPAPVVPVTATTRARTHRVRHHPFSSWHDAPPYAALIVTERGTRAPRPCYVWRPKFAHAGAVRP